MRRICIQTLCFSCTFCPVSELAGFSHSSLPSEQYLQAELQCWTSAFCSFYWPNLHAFKHKSVFSWYGVFLISQHAEHQAWQGNKGSNFAKSFLWFESGCTCLDSPAHTEGGVKRCRLVLSIQTRSAQAVQELDDSWPFFIPEIAHLPSLLEGIWVGSCLTQEVLMKVRDLEYQRQDVNVHVHVKLNIFPSLHRAKGGG